MQFNELGLFYTPDNKKELFSVITEYSYGDGVTLLYAAKDKQHNNNVTLKEYLNTKYKFQIGDETRDPCTVLLFLHYTDQPKDFVINHGSVSCLICNAFGSHLLKESMYM